ncbi:hypothetical protein, partial [Xanthomonas sp. WCS2017Cala2-12]|uniref:hypothetical protein n=1 Tax=Xanthomonas sp. WCS2017Cala2-12 TaxID=3073639 RepID=UPI00288C3E72
LKGHKINCNRHQLEAIVDLKNIVFKVYFPIKTFFQLDIFDHKKNIVFRFETDTYQGLEYLANFINYDIDILKKTILQH